MIELIKPNEPNATMLNELLKGIVDRGHYSNHGPLVKELEQKLQTMLGVNHFLSTANGTICLQLALRAIGTSGNVITTPYSYVATANAIEWQGFEARFADLCADSFFPDPQAVEDLIDANTKAILLTHVYGLVEHLESYVEIGQRAGIPVIFDAAHAFGVVYKDKPIASYGSISSFSFHATKTFHTVEGGGLALNDDLCFERVYNLRSFGHRGDTYLDVGINAKMSEVHAAFGLAQLGDINLRKSQRKAVYERYAEAFRLADVELLTLHDQLDWNYSYFPVLLSSAKTREDLKAHLEKHDIMSRRYFFPSINTLAQFSGSANCPNSENMASRVLCLPHYASLSATDQQQVIDAVNSFFGQ